MPSNAFRAIVLAAALLGAACGRPPRVPRSDVLVGTWQAEFRYGRLTRIAPALGTAIRGRIRLGPEPSSMRGCAPGATQWGFVCGSVVRGKHALGFRAVIGRSGADRPTAQGALQEDGRVLLTLGGCCDTGEVTAQGRLLADGSIAGRWGRQYLGDLPGGSFVLRRVGTR